VPSSEQDAIHGDDPCETATSLTSSSWLPSTLIPSIGLSRSQIKGWLMENPSAGALVWILPKSIVTTYFPIATTKTSCHVKEGLDGFSHIFQVSDSCQPRESMNE
jgi:hypothetical protein